MAQPVDVSELDGLVGAFDTASEKLGAAVAATVRATARKVQAAAKANAPRDTGTLADSISTSYVGKGQAREAYVGPTVYYARMVENGTARMAPHPFLAPALAAHSDDFAKAISAAAGKVL